MDNLLEIIYNIFVPHDRFHNIVVGLAASIGIFTLWWRFLHSSRNAIANERSTAATQQAEHWKRFESLAKELSKSDNLDLGASAYGVRILARGMENGSEDQMALYDRVCKIISVYALSIKTSNDKISQSNETSKSKEVIELYQQNMSNMIKIIAPSVFSDNTIYNNVNRYRISYLVKFFWKSIKKAAFIKVKREKKYRAKLNNITLPNGCDLSRRNLQGAILADTDLSGCDLREANLEGADLRRAKLIGCNLRGTSLKNANLHGAKLFDADCTDANMNGAILRNAKLGIDPEDNNNTIAENKAAILRYANFINGKCFLVAFCNFL